VFLVIRTRTWLLALLGLLVLTACQPESPEPDEAPLRFESSEVYHLGFIVEDLNSAIRSWTEQRGFGPFFLFRNFAFENPDYRGNASAPQVSIAFGFNGSLLVELIEQHDNTPSVYTEVRDRSGLGFHHFAYLSDDVDSSIRESEARGNVCVFRADFAGGRLAYCESDALETGFVEYVQRSPEIDSLLDLIYQSSRDWDGQEPIRELN
jgi:methylmalonyl-CoA/ethylmalonyl-CoA epimerase